ncbi:MAG: transcriptional regulator [Pseudomonadota bacterium]
MQTHNAKRVAIIIEAPMEKRLTKVMDQADVTGYSVLPVLGGSGRSGRWSGAGHVGLTGGMVQVICIIRPEKLNPLLEAIFSVVDKHIGVVSVSDCQVLRAERF